MRRFLLACWFVAAAWSAQAGDLDAFVRVSPRDPRYFELANGRPYVPIGLNLIAPDGAFGSEETNQLRRMDDWLGKLAAQGGNFARVWLSSDFWEIESERSGQYDDAKARRIDALLQMARRHGIRLKLTLEHFREISDRPRQRWANKRLHHVDQGGTATNVADFFAGPASRDRFRAKLDWFARRYGSDPIVFGWELWNEINAVAGGDYLAWTELMLPELHQRFPRNLALQSLGSYDHAGVCLEYARLARMPGNDVAQVHRYLDLGASLPVCHGPLDLLTADAVRTLQELQPGRPVLLAESGAVEPGHSGPFKLYAKDRDGILLHDVLFAPFFTGAAGPGHCWHWNQYIDANNLWPQFGAFAVVAKDLDPPAERFQPSQLDLPRLRVYVLHGRHTTLAWCRDKENTWQTELQQGQPPAVVSEAQLALSALAKETQTLGVRTYDPWTRRWSDLPPTPSLTLPDFKRSLVLVLQHPAPPATPNPVAR